jgi:hypothetical protein
MRMELQLAPVCPCSWLVSSGLSPYEKSNLALVFVAPSAFVLEEILVLLVFLGIRRFRCDLHM